MLAGGEAAVQTLQDQRQRGEVHGHTRPRFSAAIICVAVSKEILIASG